MKVLQGPLRLGDNVISLASFSWSLEAIFLSQQCEDHTKKRSLEHEEWVCVCLCSSADVIPPPSLALKAQVPTTRQCSIMRPFGREFKLKLSMQYFRFFLVSNAVKGHCVFFYYLILNSLTGRNLTMNEEPFNEMEKAGYIYVLLRFDQPWEDD